MNIAGSHTIPAPRQRVWELLHDPVALQRTVPGCQTLEAETPTRFSATLSVGVGPIRGRQTVQRHGGDRRHCRA